MLNRSRELWWALLTILLVTLLYSGAVYRLGSIPAARSFMGHSLGVLGFVLMLMTEILYSLRKRSRGVRWGRMDTWLQFHIYTGLVGPFLVLLHTAWTFRGLAGVVLLLTVIIVISGFIGRYIYTAVPRTADGAEMQAREIAVQMQTVEAEIARMADTHPVDGTALAQGMEALPALESGGAGLVLGRFFNELGDRLSSNRQQRRQGTPSTLAQSAELERLDRQRRTLRRQMESLAAARRLLGTWHAVHIPIGAALFTAAFVHIAAAIYYSTLLH